MPPLPVIWAGIGLVVGALGLGAGARSPIPRADGPWGGIARALVPLLATIILTVAGATLMEALAGRLAATAAAPGIATMVALIALIAPGLRRRMSAQKQSASDATTAP